MTPRVALTFSPQVLAGFLGTHTLFAETWPLYRAHPGPARSGPLPAPRHHPHWTAGSGPRPRHATRTLSYHPAPLPAPGHSHPYSAWAIAGPARPQPGLNPGRRRALPLRRPADHSFRLYT